MQSACYRRATPAYPRHRECEAVPSPLATLGVEAEQGLNSLRASKVLRGTWTGYCL